MKIVTPDQMKAIDNTTINDYSIPGIILMENAANQIKDAASKMLKGLEGKKIIIFAGKGNNGGDALAVARLLYNKKALVNTYLFNDNYTGDAALNFAIIKKMQLNYHIIHDDSHLDMVTKELESADLIIDGIFGTGIKGHVSGIIYKTIELINHTDKKVLSIDIPSGINGTTGEIMGTCLKATKTVTLALPKTGFYKGPGHEYTGALEIVDIGVPDAVMDNFNISLNLIDNDLVKAMFPKRYIDSNKGTYGKLFLVTGSQGMTGAGILASKAAYRTGSGLVYLGVPAGLTNVYESMFAESVTIPLGNDQSIYLDDNSIQQIINFSHKVDVVGIGPGLSAKDELTTFVEKLISAIEKPLVIDADGLNVIAKNITMLKSLKSKVVITPHPGEMARLTGKTISEIQNNRIEVAKEFANKWNVTVLLKGHNTVIALPNGDIYINSTGNNGMSTAGSGDVLTGIIMSLIGQGTFPEQAAIIGAYIHGLAGDQAANKLNEYSMIASDIIEKIPKAINHVQTKHKEVFT